MSSVEEPEILENNPMSQSRSCSDLKFLLNFEMDSINILNNLMPQSREIEASIRSGEGIILSSTLKKKSNNFNKD